MAIKSDQLCTYVNLVSKPHSTYIYNLSFLLIKMAIKYGFIAKKNNKNVEELFNVLAMFNLGN